MLFALFLLLLCGSVSRAAGQVDVHVANLTVVATGWPQTTAELSSFTAAVTSVVCGPLETTTTTGTAIPCGGFLAPVTQGHLSVQMYAETVSLGDALRVRRAFEDWVETDASAMLEALTMAVSEVALKSLSLLLKITGVYTVPCRSSDISEVLPVCASTRNCLTSIIVDDLGGSVSNVFCSYVPTPCEFYIAAEEISSNQVMVNISSLPNTLELALSFTDQVRRSALHASRIQLYSDGQLLQLYASNEKVAYEKAIKAIPVCGAETALWMLSFIAIIPILFLLFSYLWCMGRHHAKKVERRAIVEDELRAQEMAESHGAMAGQLGAQQLMAQNTAYPQDNVTSQTRPHEQQEGMQGEYGQFPATENFEYPQEYAAYQRQEGEGLYDGYNQQAYNEEDDAAVVDEYVEPSLVGAENDEGIQADENLSHGGHAAHP
ncbi:hypothetical protein MOQ_009501 [Trypanosoma cruzi marinkellei]|uniref:Uncharacterized protein n=1 Tax=Trypanosoma cruzi marinkellei TaxID=85056 RepID=K2MWC7_TRYCR|nr:hypothetical protein MOQ_009651 [Trypanosoma cruzi marinkellei]EKF26791.1 hypothetical protein MOQ_009501 [Trypanosoma cruzi marinkellei]